MPDDLGVNCTFAIIVAVVVALSEHSASALAYSWSRRAASPTPAQP